MNIRMVALFCMLFSYSLSLARDYSVVPGYEPLTGSDWAQAHPDKLPYSKCTIGQELIDFSKIRLKKKFFTGEPYWETPSFNEFTFAFIFGGRLAVKPDSVKSDQWYVTCISIAERIAYRVPIRLSGNYTVGEVGATASSTKLKFDSLVLNNKLFTNLYGEYLGRNTGASYYGGAMYASVQNEAKVKVIRKSKSVGFRAAFGKYHFSLNPREETTRLPIRSDDQTLDEFLIQDASILEKARFAWDLGFVE